MYMDVRVYICIEECLHMTKDLKPLKLQLLFISVCSVCIWVCVCVFLYLHSEDIFSGPHKLKGSLKGEDLVLRLMLKLGLGQALL